MKRMRIMGLSLVAVFAMSALVAGSASAATVLTLETAAGPIVSGQNLVASSSNLIFVTTAGNLECSSNVLTGEATTNKAAKDTRHDHVTSPRPVKKAAAHAKRRRLSVRP